MCTVVYIPGDNNCFFASLRDESPQRPHATVPDIYVVGNSSFLSPLDPMAGGTWIGVNEVGNVILLLNGGFENHQKKKSYRKSRGLIVSELLISEIPVVDWNLMDLEDIEPFTLITRADGNLFQLVWDGTDKHRIRLESNLPHIWSSATLYNAGVRTYREELFQNWVAMNPPVSKLSVLNFFKSYTDIENGFIMNRNDEIKTLSYSFIEFYDNRYAVLNHYNFLTYNYISRQINFSEKINRCIPD